MIGLKPSGRGEHRLRGEVVLLGLAAADVAQELLDLLGLGLEIVTLLLNRSHQPPQRGSSAAVVVFLAL